MDTQRIHRSSGERPTEDYGEAGLVDATCAIQMTAWAAVKHVSLQPSISEHSSAWGAPNMSLYIPQSRIGSPYGCDSLSRQSKLKAGSDHLQSAKMIHLLAEQGMRKDGTLINGRTTGRESGFRGPDTRLSGGSPEGPVSSESTYLPAFLNARITGFSKIPPFVPIPSSAHRSYPGGRPHVSRHDDDWDDGKNNSPPHSTSPLSGWDDTIGWWDDPSLHDKPPKDEAVMRVSPPINSLLSNAGTASGYLQGSASRVAHQARPGGPAIKTDPEEYRFLPVEAKGQVIDHTTIITVKPFDGGLPFYVQILSSLSVDKGAFSDIYRGRRTRDDGILALKVFPSRLRLREHEQEMLRRELDVAAVISDRCHRILPFIGTATYVGRTILAAPFMRNGNLLQYMERRAESAINRRSLVSQVAEAVDFLHTEANIAHGDLKCENVLVGDDGQALLADFGLSTVADKDESEQTTMTSIRLWNTLRFAAPEILLGIELEDATPTAGQVGVRQRPRSKTRESDVYAFGMLILQAFTGMKPWPLLENLAVLKNVCLGHVHPHPGEEATLRGFSDTLWTVCLECWQFEAHLRPQMSTVLRELEMFPQS